MRPITATENYEGLEIAPPGIEQADLSRLPTICRLQRLG